VKVLSIWGPWAQLIAYGWKDVENRSWSTSFRGPLAIHCSKSGWTNSDADEILGECIAHGLIDGAMAAAITGRLQSDRGKVIAIATVIGCGRSDDHASPWAVPGGRVIELADARLVKPVSMRGHQGMRDLPDDIASQLTS
jgi:hypothetical protein